MKRHALLATSALLAILAGMPASAHAVTPSGVSTVVHAAGGAETPPSTNVDQVVSSTSSAPVADGPQDAGAGVGVGTGAGTETAGGGGRPTTEGDQAIDGSYCDEGNCGPLTVITDGPGEVTCVDHPNSPPCEASGSGIAFVSFPNMGQHGPGNAYAPGKLPISATVVRHVFTCHLRTPSPTASPSPSAPPVQPVCEWQENVVRTQVDVPDNERPKYAVTVDHALDVGVTCASNFRMIVDGKPIILDNGSVFVRKYVGYSVRWNLSVPAGGQPRMTNDLSTYRCIPPAVASLDLRVPCYRELKGDTLAHLPDTSLPAPVAVKGSGATVESRGSGTRAWVIAMSPQLTLYGVTIERTPRSTKAVKACDKTNQTLGWGFGMSSIENWSWGEYTTTLEGTYDLLTIVRFREADRFGGKPAEFVLWNQSSLYEPTGPTSNQVATWDNSGPGADTTKKWKLKTYIYCTPNAGAAYGWSQYYWTGLNGTRQQWLDNKSLPAGITFTGTDCATPPQEPPAKLPPIDPDTGRPRPPTDPAGKVSKDCEDGDCTATNGGPASWFCKTDGGVWYIDKGITDRDLAKDASVYQRMRQQADARKGERARDVSFFLGDGRSVKAYRDVESMRDGEWRALAWSPLEPTTVPGRATAVRNIRDRTTTYMPGVKGTMSPIRSGSSDEIVNTYVRNADGTFARTASGAAILKRDGQERQPWVMAAPDGEPRGFGDPVLGWGPEQRVQNVRFFEAGYSGKRFTIQPVFGFTAEFRAEVPQLQSINLTTGVPSFTYKTEWVESTATCAADPVGILVKGVFAGDMADTDVNWN